MAVIHIAAEHSDYVYTGGLGEVVKGLSEAQAALGADVRVILPGFRATLEALPEAERDGDVVVTLPWGPVSFEVRTIVRGEVKLHLLCCAAFFDRPTPYGGSAGPYPDNPVRFSAFSRAAASLASGHAPDVIHLHDWHVGLAAPHLTRYRAAGSSRAKVVMTVHNLAFSGAFATAAGGLTGLPAESFGVDGVTHGDAINPLKAGLQFADVLTTVSPTYAKELQTDALGWDYAGLFRYRAADLHGITNGLMSSSPSPTGPREPRRAALCEQFGIEPPPGPLFAMVSRLTGQKGVDLLVKALPAALEAGAGLVVLGTGESELEASLHAAAADNPHVGFMNTFAPALATSVFEGADVVVVPSRFEPCGLTQLHAMHAGALPLVRRTGGLADTVRDVSEAAGWGFVFDEASAAALSACLIRATALHGDPIAWRTAVEAGLAQPLGWNGPATAYLELYGRTVIAGNAASD